MNLELLSLFALLFVLLYLLVKSADLIEDVFTLVARKVGVSEFLIGFVILGAVSSAPEFAISLHSSTQAPELSLGNIYGGTLIILSLLVGYAAIKFKGITFTGTYKIREMFSGLIVILMSYVVLLDKNITVFEGFLLILLYVLYIGHIFRVYGFKKDVVSYGEEKTLPAEKTFRLLMRSALGIVMILITSFLIVDTAIEIGEKLNVNKAFIGLIVLAVGTNIGELVIIHRAKTVDQIKLAMGAAFGTAVMHTPIIGILAIVAKGINLSENNDVFISLIPVFVILTLALTYTFVFSFTNKKITKFEGFLLLGVYLSFIITELLLLTILY